MKKFLLLLCAMALVFGLASNSMAIPSVGDLPIDFRISAWNGADSQYTFTVDGVTATALPGSTLYQDNTDGLGVRSTLAGDEFDEIEQNERLRIDLQSSMYVTGVWITDLFDYPDGGGNPSGERGMVGITTGSGDPWWDFSGINADQGNGELYVDFGGAYLTNVLRFNAVPFGTESGDIDNEFSVAGINAAPVPEPATMLLLGVGLIGIAGVGRKRLLKKP
jgi:hypothetical protein